MNEGVKSLGQFASDELASGQNFSSPGHTEGASQRSAWLREISAAAGRSPQALESRGRCGAGTSAKHPGRIENEEQSVWSGMLQEMFREKESLIASLKSSRAREEAAVRDQSVFKERVQAAENGREAAEKALIEYKESQKKFLREKQLEHRALSKEHKEMLRAHKDLQGLLAACSQEKKEALEKAAAADARAAAACLACEQGTKTLVEETTRLTRLLEAAAARCDAAERRAEEIGRQHERERGEFEREVGRLRGMASSFSDEARMSIHFNSAELGEARRRAADAEANLCAASEALETASRDAESAKRDAESAKRDAESAKRDAEAAKGEREIAMRDKSTAEMEKEVAVRERDCAVEKLEAAEASSRHRVEELEGEVEGLCALAEEERRAKVEAEESMKLVNVQLEVFRAEERCRGAEWEAARATLEDQNKRYADAVSVLEGKLADAEASHDKRYGQLLSSHTDAVRSLKQAEDEAASLVMSLRLERAKQGEERERLRICLGECLKGYEDAIALAGVALNGAKGSASTSKATSNHDVSNAEGCENGVKGSSFTSKAEPKDSKGKGPRKLLKILEPPDVGFEEEEAQSMLKILDEECSLLQRQRDLLRAKEQAASAEKDAALKQRDAAVIERDALLGERDSLRKEMGRMIVCEGALEHRVAELERALEEVSLDKSQKGVGGSHEGTEEGPGGEGGAEEEVLHLRDKLLEGDAQRRVLEEEVTCLQQKLCNAQRGVVEALEGSRRSVAKLRAIEGKAAKETEMLLGRVAEADGQCETLKYGNISLVQERDALKAERDAVKDEMGVIRGDMEALEGMYEALKARDGKLLSERDALLVERDEALCEREAMSAKLDGAMSEMSRKLGGEIEGMRVLLCEAEDRALEMESKAAAASARAADAEAAAERERARADAAVEEAAVEARRGSEARRRSVELEDKALVLLQREESLRVAVLEAEEELRAVMAREIEANELNKKLSASVIELDEAVQRAEEAQRDAEMARGERDGLKAKLYAVSGALDEMAAEVRGAVGDAECIRECMEGEVEEAVADAVQEVGRLRCELQRVLGERDAAYREVSCVRGERDAAAASIARERSEWEALVRVAKDESESVWKEVEAAMREREGVREELVAARRERDQAKGDAVSLREQLGVAVTELGQARGEVSSLRKESELEAALGEEVMRLTVELEALRGERGRGRAAEGELAGVVAELEDVKARVVEALERAEIADKGRKEAVAELEQAREEVLSLLKERDALSCERDACMEVVLRLEGEIKSAKREAEKVKGGLELELEGLRSAVETIKREAAEVREEEGEWERALNKAREEREWALGELGDALERCEMMKEGEILLRERVTEHEAWLCVLEECAGEEVGEGFTSISSLVAKFKELESKAEEVDWLRSRCATLEKERSDLEGAVEEHDAWLSLLEECGAEGSNQGFSSISALIGRVKELEAETGSLREKLEAVDGRADAAQNQVAMDLRHKLEMKDSELSDCKEKLGRKEREANDAKVRIEELDQTIKAAVADAEANQDALKVMREVLEGDASRRALVDQLETEVSECREEIETTRSEVIEWRAEVQRRDAELTECREEIETTRSEVIEWRAEVQRRDAELTECREKIETTRSEVIEWRAEVQRRDAELTECREKIETTRSEVIEWREELKVTSTRLELAIKEAEAQSMYAKGLEKEVAALESERDALSGERDAVISDLEALACDVEELKRGFEAERYALESSASVLKADLEVAAEKRRELEKRTEAARAECEELNARVEALAGERDALLSSADAVRAEREREADSESSEVVSLRKRLNVAEELCEEVRGERDANLERLRACEEELENANMDVSRLASELDSAQARLSQSMEEVSRLACEIERAREEARSAQSLLDSANEQAMILAEGGVVDDCVLVLNEEVLRLESAGARLWNALSNARERLKTCESELSDLRSERDALLEKVGDAERRACELEGEPEETKERARGLEKSVEGLSEEWVAVEKQMEVMREELGVARREKDQAREEVLILKKEKGLEGGGEEGMKERLAEVHGERDEEARGRKEAETALEEALRSYEEAQGLIEGALVEAEEAQKALSESRIEAQNLSNRLDSARLDCKQLSSDLQSAVSDLSALASSVWSGLGDSAAGGKAVSGEERKRLSTKIVQLQWELERAGAERKRLVQEAERLQTEEKLSYEELERAHDEIRELRSEVTDLTKALHRKGTSASKLGDDPMKGKPPQPHPSAIPSAAGDGAKHRRPLEAATEGRVTRRSAQARSSLSSHTVASAARQSLLSDKENAGNSNQVQPFLKKKSSLSAGGIGSTQELVMKLTGLLETVEGLSDGACNSRRSSSTSRNSIDGATSGNSSMLGGGEIISRLTEALHEVESTIRAKDRAIKDGNTRIKTLEMEWGDMRRRSHLRMSPPPDTP